MKARYLNKQRARRSVKESVEESYKYFLAQSMLVLVDEFEWDYPNNVDNTNDLDLLSFERFVNMFVEAKILENTDAKFLKEKVFSAGCFDPNEVEGYAHNLYDILMYSAMYILGTFFEFDEDKLNKFADAMHEKRGYFLRTFDEHEDRIDSIMSKIEGYGIKLSKQKDQFYAKMERFIFNLPKILKRAK